MEPAHDTATAPRSGLPPPDAPLPTPFRRDGQPVVLDDGREWLIPPLNFRQIHGPAIDIFMGLLRKMMMLGDGTVGDVIVGRALTEGVAELLRMSLDRNYPGLGLTLDDCLDLLNQNCAIDVLKIIYDLNGFVLEVFRRLGIALPQTTETAPEPGKTGERNA